MQKLFYNRKIEFKWGRGSRFNLARKYLPEIFVKTNKSLLDVGCGGTASEWQSSFKDYRGLDFEGSYKGIPKEELGDNFIISDFDDGELFEVEAADIVICLDVLEHISKPHRLMECLKDITKEKLIISLPNNWFKFDQQFKKGRSSYSGYGLPPMGFAIGQQHKFFFNAEEAIKFIEYFLDEEMKLTRIIIDLRPGYSGNIYNFPIIGKLLKLITLPKPATFHKVFPRFMAFPLAGLSDLIFNVVSTLYNLKLRFHSVEAKRKFMNQQAAGVWFLIERKNKHV